MGAGILASLCIALILLASSVRADAPVSTENFALEFEQVTVNGDYNAAKGITATSLTAVDGKMEVLTWLEVQGALQVPVLKVQGDMMSVGTLNVDTILVTDAPALDIEGDCEINGVLLANQLSSGTKQVHVKEGVEISGTLISKNIAISGGRLDLNGNVPINGSLTGPLIWPAGDMLTINGTLLRVEGAVNAQNFISSTGKVTFSGTLQLRAPLTSQFIRSLSGQILVNNGLRISRSKNEMAQQADHRSPAYRSLLLTQSDMQAYVSLRTEIENLGRDWVQVFKGHKLCPSSIDFGFKGVGGGSTAFTVRTDHLANGEFHFHVVGSLIHSHEHADGTFGIHGMGDAVRYEFKFSTDKCTMHIKTHKRVEGKSVTLTGLQRGSMELLYPTLPPEQKEFDVITL